MFYNFEFFFQILLGLVMLGVGIYIKKRTIKKKQEPNKNVDLEHIDTQQK